MSFAAVLLIAMGVSADAFAVALGKGLTMRRLHAPTAAAIAYGLEQESDQTVLVYDLGGGTFDVTMIEIKDRLIRVVCTGGDHRLGGVLWDEAVVMYLAEQFREQTGEESDPLDDPEVLNVPPGTQPGTEFRLRGKGMPRLQNVGTGDVVVDVQVEIPKHLSQRARELMEAYATETGERLEAHETLGERLRGLFGKRRVER